MARLVVRPMEAEDVDGAAAAWDAANASSRARLGLPPVTRSASEAARLRGRIDLLRRTDPAGAWVAASGKRVVGLGQSFVRDHYWVLSLLAVLAEFGGAGVGGRLLEATMGTLDPGDPATIQASRDPAAVRLYQRAGFDLHPAVTTLLEGRPARPPAARPGGPPGDGSAVRRGGAADVERLAEVDRRVRGAERTDLLRHLVEQEETTLLVRPAAGDERGRGALDGYSLTTPERMVTLAAVDETTAGELLTAALGTIGSSRPFQVMWLTAAQQWALRVAAAHGATVHPQGPVMVRGLSSPPSPYLPSGSLG